MGFLDGNHANFFDGGDEQDPWGHGPGSSGGSGLTPPAVPPPLGAPLLPPVNGNYQLGTPGGSGGSGGGGGGWGGGGFDLGSFPNVDFGQVPGFTAPEFVAPTPESVLNSPDYQSRLKSGTDALEASAAARGMTRTGGTLKDIIDYGKKFGQGEYDSSYNHSLQGYQTNYQRLRDQFAPKLAGWQANAQAALARVLAIYGRGTAWNMPHGGGGGGGVPDLEPGWTPFGG